jgi:hypothetical protein
MPQKEVTKEDLHLIEILRLEDEAEINSEPERYENDFDLEEEIFYLLERGDFSE